MKSHNPAFTIFDHWEALCIDYSEAQFQGLYEAVRTFLSNEGRTPTEIHTFIDKVFQGCLVHWFRSAQRVAAIATRDADQQSIFLRDCHRLPKVSESERKKIWSNLMHLFPGFKRWVNWWRWPHYEAFLCHLEAKGTLQQWLSRPLDTKAAESHNYIAQIAMNASPTRLLISWFDQNCLAAMQCKNVERCTGRVARRSLLVNTALGQTRPCKRRQSKVDANDGRGPNTKAPLASGPSKIAKLWQDTSPRASASTRSTLSPRALSFSLQDSVRSDKWFGTPTPQSAVPLSPFATPAPIAAASQARHTGETPLASSSMQQVAPPHVACSVVPSLGSATSSQPLFSTTPPLSLEHPAAAAHARKAGETAMGNPSMEPS